MTVSGTQIPHIFALGLGWARHSEVNLNEQTAIRVFVFTVVFGNRGSRRNEKIYNSVSSCGAVLSVSASAPTPQKGQVGVAYQMAPYIARCGIPG